MQVWWLTHLYRYNWLTYLYGSDDWHTIRSDDWFICMDLTDWFICMSLIDEFIQFWWLAQLYRSDDWHICTVLSVQIWWLTHLYRSDDWYICTGLMSDTFITFVRSNDWLNIQYVVSFAMVLKLLIGRQYGTTRCIETNRTFRRTCILDLGQRSVVLFYFKKTNNRRSRPTSSNLRRPPILKTRWNGLIHNPDLYIDLWNSIVSIQ